MREFFRDIRRLFLFESSGLSIFRDSLSLSEVNGKLITSLEAIFQQEVILILQLCPHDYKQFF